MKARKDMQSLARHCDRIAESYDALAKLAARLGMHDIVSLTDPAVPQTFRSLAEEWRKQAERL